jgi:hypothetical protein
MPEIKPVIFTPLKETAIYARDVLGLEAVHGLRDEHVWSGIRARKIKNVLICYQKIAGDPRGLNTIQIFHGVSFKGPDLANWSPARWEHVLVQGEHFWKPYVQRYAEHAHKIHRVTFARESLYRDLPPWDQSGPVLYMPTHRDSGLANLRANIELVCSLSQRVMIKLHPINQRTEPFMNSLRSLWRTHKNVELITPDNPLYFNYDELFKRSSCLISDFSSVVCEYTLMDRPIVILRGGPNGGRDLPKDFRHLSQHLFHVPPDRNLANTIKLAKLKFQPGSYPNLFIKDDCTEIVTKIRELFV